MSFGASVFCVPTTELYHKNPRFILFVIFEAFFVIFDAEKQKPPLPFRATAVVNLKSYQ